MFVLCKRDFVFETVHLLGAFNNQEDAERACSLYNDNSVYYVDECAKFTSDEDYWVNVLETMCQEKSDMIEELHQKNQQLASKYNEKVREVEEVRQLLEKYREKVKLLEEQNNS